MTSNGVTYMILTVNKESGDLTVQQTGCTMSITRTRVQRFMRFVWSNAKLDHETQDTEVWDVNEKILRLLEVGYHFHTPGMMTRLTEYSKQPPTAANKSLENRANRVVLVHKIFQATAGGETTIEITKDAALRFQGPTTARTMTLTTPKNTVAITSAMISRMGVAAANSNDIYFERTYEMIKYADKGLIEEGFYALSGLLNPISVTINNAIISPISYYSLGDAFKTAAELKTSILGVAALT